LLRFLTMNLKMMKASTRVLHPQKYLFLTDVDQTQEEGLIHTKILLMMIQTLGWTRMPIFLLARKLLTITNHLREVLTRTPKLRKATTMLMRKKFLLIMKVCSLVVPRLQQLEKAFPMLFQHPNLRVKLKFNTRLMMYPRF